MVPLTCDAQDILATLFNSDRYPFLLFDLFVDLFQMAARLPSNRVIHIVVALLIVLLIYFNLPRFNSSEHIGGLLGDINNSTLGVCIDNQSYDTWYSIINGRDCIVPRDLRCWLAVTDRPPRWHVPTSCP